MKKISVIIVAIALGSLSLYSCGSTKGGCGLTSDANTIERHIDVETESVAGPVV